VAPDLDAWLPKPSIRVAHRRVGSASPDRLWEAARSVALRDAPLLARLIRWRIPSTPAEITFDEMFRRAPFIVLAEEPGRALLSGMVGRIWIPRREYPRLSSPAEFAGWSISGTARVVFGHWVEPAGEGRCALLTETRVEAIGLQGKLGLAALRPIVRAFQHLVATDGIDAAIRRAEEHRD
jgi:hypothetical protein